MNEGLYFRSPRLATRFESNAANIAKVLVKALLNLIIKFNIQEIQVVKTSQGHISSAFLKKFIVKISKTLCDRRIYHHVFLQTIAWFLSFRAVRMTAPKSPNSSASVLKTSSQSGVVGKQRNIAFVGFLGNVEPKWCRKYRK